MAGRAQPFVRARPRIPSPTLRRRQGEAGRGVPGHRRPRARSGRRGPRRSPARSPGRGRRRPRRARRRRGRRPRRRARRRRPGSPRRRRRPRPRPRRPCGRARTVTLPSAGVWRIAFWIRLKRTRWTFSASASATTPGAGSSAASRTPRSLGRRPHRRHGLADQLAELDLAQRPGDVAGLDPRELEEVVDQVAEDGDVGADLGQVAVAGLAGGDAVVDRVDQQPQRGERRAQVVRGGGDQRPPRLLDFAPRPLLHRQPHRQRRGERGARRPRTATSSTWSSPIWLGTATAAAPARKAASGDRRRRASRLATGSRRPRPSR